MTRPVYKPNLIKNLTILHLKGNQEICPERADLKISRNCSRRQSKTRGLEKEIRRCRLNATLLTNKMDNKLFSKTD